MLAYNIVHSRRVAGGWLGGLRWPGRKIAATGQIATTGETIKCDGTSEPRPVREALVSHIFMAWHPRVSIRRETTYRDRKTLKLCRGPTRLFEGIPWNSTSTLCRPMAGSSPNSPASVRSPSQSGLACGPAAEGGLGNVAEYPLCPGAMCAFAVRDLLERADPELILGESTTLGIAVGFDSGDFITPRRIRPVRAREPRAESRLGGPAHVCFHR